MSEDKADAGKRKKILGLTIGLIVTGLIAVVLLGVLIWSVNSKVSEDWHHVKIFGVACLVCKSREEPGVLLQQHWVIVRKHVFVRLIVPPINFATIKWLRLIPRKSWHQMCVYIRKPFMARSAQWCEIFIRQFWHLKSGIHMHIQKSNYYQHYVWKFQVKKKTYNIHTCINY